MSKKSVAERKKEREQGKQRDQVKYGIIAIVIVAAVAAVIFLATSQTTAGNIPSTLNRTDKYLQDVTAEGYPRLGNPAAPVELREYASFACSGCLNFHDTIFPQLLPLVESGQINLVFVPLETGSVPNPEGANRTAICAGAQGKFWQMHEVLFSWQSLYGNAAFQDGRLRGAVNSLGLDGGVFNGCINSASTNAVLDAAVAEGITNTPYVTVNGVPTSADMNAIVTAIQTALAGRTDYASGLRPVEATEAVAPTQGNAPTQQVAPTSEATEAVAPTSESTEAPAEETSAVEATEAQ